MQAMMILALTNSHNCDEIIVYRIIYDTELRGIICKMPNQKIYEKKNTRNKIRTVLPGVRFGYQKSQNLKFQPSSACFNLELKLQQLCYLIVINRFS